MIAITTNSSISVKAVRQDRSGSVWAQVMG
jgi:hypothetical protein